MLGIPQGVHPTMLGIPQSVHLPLSYSLGVVYVRVLYLGFGECGLFNLGFGRMWAVLTSRDVLFLPFLTSRDVLFLPVFTHLGSPFGGFKR